MTKEEIYNKLQNYKSIDRIQLVRADYKGTNEGFNEQLTNIINELQSDYDMKYYKRLNDLCMILDKAENENDLDRIKNIESQIESHEKTVNNPFLVSLKKEIENYIKQSETQQLESKGILTNETFYNVLENCTIEAFERLKLKESYPKNGTKAIWDIGSLTITKGNGLPTDRDNELFRKEYILENMRVHFLNALDRYCNDFEIKHSIKRTIFYKKCYESLLLKASQSSLWHEPDFGFDIDKEPCKLTFIWNMRNDIEARSFKPNQNKSQQTETELINNYKKAISGYFKYVINEKDSFGNRNPHYYIDFISNFKNGLDYDLKENKFLKERYELLNTFNFLLSNLMIDIIQLFIACDKYDGIDKTIVNDITISKIQVDFEFNAIKNYSQKIKAEIGKGNPSIAIKIKNYCIPLFEKISTDLKDTFFIDIKNSPLNNDFNEVLNELENSINLVELSLLNEISKNEQPQQTEAKKTDEVIKEFKDFFNPDVNIKVVEKIQNDFKDCIGKKMAYLIYLLESDLKFITYSLNGKNDSRKHFVESLISKKISMQGINKYFEPNDVKLKIFQFEKASDFINIKEKLIKTIK